MTLLNGTDALFKLVDSSGVPGFGLKQVWEAFGSPAGKPPGSYAKAIDSYRASQSRHALEYDPPRGAPVFFFSPKGGGAVGISAGRGLIVIPDPAGNARKLTIREAEQRFHWSYAGWTGDFMGNLVSYVPSASQDRQRVWESRLRRRQSDLLFFWIISIAIALSVGALIGTYLPK